MIAVAYLLGSIPFGVIFYKLFRRGGNLQDEGSGNIGATNVARTAGALPGILTLVADILKGYFAIAACQLAGISFDSWAIAFAALAALAGHMFPVWLAFRGGKGIATGLGVFLGLAWHVALMAFAVFALCVLATRIVSLSSLVATAAFVALSFALGDWLHIGFNVQIGSVLAGLLIVVRHYENIGRLLTGKEKRFSLGGKSKSAPEDGE